MYYLIINGKKAGREDIRESVYHLRGQGHNLQVRSTWEGGDVERFYSEALAEGAERVIIGGGDGSINEITNVLMARPLEQRLPVAILPLGTANDFATACGIPKAVHAALELALTGKPALIDAVSVNQHYFANVASAGFGAKVTAETPVDLKNFLGGGAYVLSGLLQALRFNAYASDIKGEGFELSADIMVAAVCNGRQAGGGQILAPAAKINDGLLDVAMLLNFPPAAATSVLAELTEATDGSEYVKRYQTAWLEVDCKAELPINLDGEPYLESTLRFDICPAALHFILPNDCPLI